MQAGPISPVEDETWLANRIGPVCLKHRTAILEHVVPFAHQQLEQYEAALKYQLFDDAVALHAMEGLCKALTYLSNADRLMRQTVFAAGEA